MWKRDLSPWYCPVGSAMAEDFFCRRLSPRCHPEGGAVAEDSSVYSSLTFFLIERHKYFKLCFNNVIYYRKDCIGSKT